MNRFYCVLLATLQLLLTIQVSHGFIEGLYCGVENCYEVLGVDRKISKADLGRAYRQLAAKYHPDKHKNKEAKEKASQKFTSIATAYEILKDEDSRKDYDYMLDNPDEIYRHYFSYYRRRMTPKVDYRIVIAVTVTIISIVQYWGAWQRYKVAIDYYVTVPRFRLQAQDIAKESGLISTEKKRDKRPKSVQKEEEEKILKEIIAEKMDIGGGYSKPSIRNILWLQLLFLPYEIALFVWFHCRWIWKFNLMGHPFDTAEKHYLIRKYLKLSESQFNYLPEKEVEEMMKKELWVYDLFKVWKEKRDADMKAKLAESARYKSYRRYMKNHGPGQISFDE